MGCPKQLNARAKPVVGVEAGGELLFACENGIPQAAITAVEGEDGALVVEEVHELSGSRLKDGVGLAKDGFAYGETAL